MTPSNGQKLHHDARSAISSLQALRIKGQPLRRIRKNKHTLTSRILTNYKQSIMGSIFSAIGRGINSVVSAIAGVIMAIVSAITTVIVTIFDVILDILCCRCFGSRRSSRRTGRSRRGGAGRSGAGTF
ncbi:hypothetical protein GGX14DRAFT_693042 [Mycena pura]|uniref:Uncharacterized protein n=1 Tax=Mycena pura TaxID=153505 RepID=A0AAD6YR27_9AGAR|nr:hypothetical protein GGX14DRAFT_693042 [Mycena pura]